MAESPFELELRERANGGQWVSRFFIEVNAGSTAPAAKATADTTPPTVTIDATADGMTPLTSTGTAADDVGLSSVEVRIYNGFAVQVGTVACTVAGDGSWVSAPWDSGGFSGNYEAYAVATDTSLNVAQAGPSAFVISVATVPDVPTGLVAAPGDTLVTLSWSAPASDGGSPITNYDLQARPSGGTWATVGSPVGTTAAVTGLTNGLAYDFRVAAVNAVGTGTYTAQVTASPTGAVVPGVPVTGTISLLQHGFGGSTMESAMNTELAGTAGFGKPALTAAHYYSLPGGTAASALAPIQANVELWKNSEYIVLGFIETGVTGGASYTDGLALTNWVKSAAPSAKIIWIEGGRSTSADGNTAIHSWLSGSTIDAVVPWKEYADTHTVESGGNLTAHDVYAEYILSAVVSLRDGDTNPLVGAVPSGITAASKVTLTTSANNTTIQGYPDNTVFWLPNGTYTGLKNLTPKAGQQFVGESKAGVIIQGGGATVFASGKTSGCSFSRMTFRGFTGGSLSQSDGIIRGSLNPWYYGSSNAAKDWSIYECDFEIGGAVGVILGHRFKVVGCRFFEHSPFAIGGSRATGGLIYGNTFHDNGFQGASGSSVNNSQMKFTWWNISSPMDHVDVASTPLPDQTEIPETLRVIRNDLDCKRYTGTGDDTRGVWFDLDCRDTQVAYNRFVDSASFGVFYEGCNGGKVHHNHFLRCGNSGAITFDMVNGGETNSSYISYAAITTGSSDNVDAWDNEIEDCDAGLLFFLGERARNGGDWNRGDSTRYASAEWHMLRNIFTPAAIGERSTVGSSNNKCRNNRFLGTTKWCGAFNSVGITTAEQNLGTLVFTGNTYGPTQTAGDYFLYDGARQTLVQWQAAGRQ